MLRRVVVGTVLLAATAAAQWSQIEFAPPGATYRQILLNQPAMRLRLLGTQDVTSSANYLRQP